jgi:hypothetical protein
VLNILKMREKKPNTLQTRFGFADEELKTPRHDALMLWLDKNIESLVNKLFRNDLTSEVIEKLQAEAIENLKTVVTDRTRVLRHFVNQAEYYEKKESPSSADKESLKSYRKKIEEENKKINLITTWKTFKTIPETPDVSILEKKWELPVTTQAQYNNGNSSKYTVGFVDMSVQFAVPKPRLGGITSSRDNELRSGEWIYDLKNEPYIDFEYERHSMYIEVKTEISSIGELVRQINHYKEYLKGMYYVLCPNNPHKEILEQQGIGCLAYKGN